MNQFGRIIVCGMISEYNKEESESYGVKKLMHIVAKRITFRGFIVSDKDFGPKYFEEHNKMSRSGLLKEPSRQR
jgi:NADPH-dependent curcumin reductase CurA